MNRNIALDILKLALAFMVIGLHSGFLNDISPIANYMTVNGLFRIAVPIFLLINGFYFYPVLTGGKVKNWLKKVIYLYSFWMLFYSYFWFKPAELSISGIATVISQIIIGYHHLWYISGMIGAAVLLSVINKMSNRILFLATFITFFTGVAIHYLGNFHIFQTSIIDTYFNYNWVHRNLLLFSFPFFCLGFLINKLKLQDKISTKNVLFICILGLILVFIESYLNYVNLERAEGLDNLISLIIAAPALFILFTKINIKGRSKNIALYSSAIYFIHSFFLSVIRKTTDFEGTSGTISVIILSILASYFLIEINKKLKFIF